MIILGITGGVGSGKSRVLYELSEKYDAYVIEADKLAHELMKKGGIIYNEVVKCFGMSVADPDTGEIDRARLGNIVFNDRQKLELLNSISHPLVKEEIKRQIEIKRLHGVKLFVIEAALLIQDGYREICDEIWYIYVGREERQRRLMASRGYTPEKCKSMFESQESDEYYINNADCIINNEKDYEITSKQIKAQLNKLL